MAALISVPDKLPGAALGSRWVPYGLWVLKIFYGFLLLFLPLVRALKGQLPIELSLRGPSSRESRGRRGRPFSRTFSSRLATAASSWKRRPRLSAFRR